MADLTDGRDDTDSGHGPLGAMTLCPVPESVPRARRWFRKFIARHDPACSLEDCQVMISELVTNAIVYGRAEKEWRVRVAWWREGEALRVDVHSPGHPGRVRMREDAPDDAHGRGLRLVDALADSWSVGPSAYGGTVVSFVMEKAWPS
ncbi:ATP-binding protein [Streptomyces sp. TRM70308]|uniref:ATP-binding protein n=1 Tax=Streptomyces sp. TRM70308 TaxID=3131932 RepID=UPI003CFCBD45